MPDVWADVSALDSAMQDRLAGVLEDRGADAQQRVLRETFLAEIAFEMDARVLDVGAAPACSRASSPAGRVSRRW